MLLSRVVGARGRGVGLARLARVSRTAWSLPRRTNTTVAATADASTSSGSFSFPGQQGEELLTALYRNKSLLVWANPLTQPVPPAPAPASNISEADPNTPPAAMPALTPLAPTSLPAPATSSASQDGQTEPRIYVLGTDHTLIDSALHVRELIRTVKPDVVLIESCRERVQPPSTPASDSSSSSSSGAAAAAAPGWTTDPATGLDLLTRPITFDTDAYLSQPHNMYHCPEAASHPACAQVQTQAAAGASNALGTVEWWQPPLEGSDVVRTVRANFWKNPAVALRTCVQYYYQYLDDLLNIHSGIEMTVAAKEAQRIGNDIPPHIQSSESIYLSIYLSIYPYGSIN
jgi:hypothetical protein